MTMRSVSDDQIAQLRAIVDRLSADQKTASDKKAASVAAMANSVNAQTAAAVADADWKAADVKVTDDTTELRAFVDTLAAGPAPEPPPDSPPTAHRPH